MIRACRQQVLSLLGLPPTHPEQVIFGLNCSDVNNLAIHGVINHALRQGRSVHVLTTDLDHNSVLRPIRSREIDRVPWTCVTSDPDTGRVTSATMHDAIDAAARRVGPDGLVLVVMTHASNVLGSIQPVEAVGNVCRRMQAEHGTQVLFMLDAAQTAGHVPMRVNQWNVDLWTAPGHKGLLGPMGTGVLWIRPGVEAIMDPLRQGGTGSRSELDTQPMTMPDKFEPGSHNAPGIAGLNAALEWIHSTGLAFIAQREHDIVATFLSDLASLESAGYALLGPRTVEDRVAIFTLMHTDLDAHTLATLLETEHDILARAGLHCAPRAHAACGTSHGGGLRLSFSVMNSPDDARAAIAALLRVASHARPRVIHVARGSAVTQ
jgi:selenocysteine lyase/cysteine desulfurase